VTEITLWLLAIWVLETALSYANNTSHLFFKFAFALSGGAIARWLFRLARHLDRRSNRGDFMREVLDTWDSLLKYEPQLADEHAIACEWLTKTWTVAELAEPAKSGLTIEEMQHRKRGVKP